MLWIRKRPRWVRILGLIISVPGGFLFVLTINLILGLHAVSSSKISDSEAIQLLFTFSVYIFDIALFVTGMRVSGFIFTGYWNWLEMSQIEMDLADKGKHPID